MSSNSNPFPNRAPCSRLLRTMSRTILNISTIFLGNLCWCPASYTINKCLLLFRGKLLSSIFRMLLLVLVLGTTEKNLTPLSAPFLFFQIFMHTDETDKISPEPPVLHDEHPQLSQLFLREMQHHHLYGLSPICPHSVCPVLGSPELDRVYKECIRAYHWRGQFYVS